MRALLASLISCLPAPQDRPCGQVRELIERLGSDFVQDREEATRRLKALGWAVLPEIERAAGDQDPEVSSRARHLLRAIPIAEALTPNLKRVFPGIEERLIRGDGRTWTEVFLEAGEWERLGKPKRLEVRRTDLIALVRRALRGAVSPEEKENVCWIVVLWHLDAAVPEVVQMLKDSASPMRSMGCFTLRSLDARGQVGAVAGLLGDADPAVCGEAIRTLGDWGAREYVPQLMDALGGGAGSLRVTAGLALGWMGAEESLPGLLKLLASESGDTRKGALAALGYLRAREAIPEVARSLLDPESKVREEAAWTLASLDARDQIRGLLALLEDPDVSVRTSAISGLKRLRARESIPALIGLLESDWVSIPRSAARALGELDAREAVPALVRRLGGSADRESIARVLGRMRATEAIPAVVKLLEDADPSVREDAVRALEGFEARESAPGIRRLLEDSDAKVRVAAASWLCGAGFREGVPVLLAESANLAPLNALRSPERWRRLGTIRADRWLGGRVEEILAALAKGAGLGFEGSEDQEPWVYNRQWLGAGDGRRTVLDALKEALCESPGVVLEADRLVLLPREELVDFWRMWWASRKKE